MYPLQSLHKQTEQALVILSSLLHPFSQTSYVLLNISLICKADCSQQSLARRIQLLLPSTQPGNTTGIPVKLSNVTGDMKMDAPLSSLSTLAMPC